MMEHIKGELRRGCVVFMKASSGLTGYGNGQCVSDVCEELGTVSLFAHNQHYYIHDIDRIIEYPISKDSHDALLDACIGLMKEADDGSARFDDPAPDSIFIKAKQAIAEAEVK